MPDLFPLVPDYPIRRRLLDRKTRTPLQNGNLKARTQGADLMELDLEAVADLDAIDSLLAFYQSHASVAITFSDQAFTPTIDRTAKFMGPPAFDEAENQGVRWRCTLQEVPS